MPEARNHSNRARSWLGVALALSSCEDANTPSWRGDSEFMPQPAHGDCLRVEGTVGEYSPYGVPSAGERLRVFPDRVEALDVKGGEVDCSVSPLTSKLSFECMSTRVMTSVTVHVAQQSWTQSFGEYDCDRDYTYLVFQLDDLEPCVPKDQIVLEGELLNYAPEGDAFARVWLRTSAIEWYYVGDAQRECSLIGTHYTCASLGYRYHVQHTLVAEHKGDTLTIPVKLPVQDCQVERQTRDIELKPATHP